MIESLKLMHFLRLFNSSNIPFGICLMFIDLKRLSTFRRFYFSAPEGYGKVFRSRSFALKICFTHMEFLRAYSWFAFILNIWIIKRVQSDSPSRLWIYMYDNFGIFMYVSFLLMYACVCSEYFLFVFALRVWKIPWHWSCGVLSILWAKQLTWKRSCKSQESFRSNKRG